MTSGAWIVLGAAVGAVGAVLGGLVERRSRSRVELARSAAAFLAAAEALSRIAQRDVLLLEGPSNPPGRALEWLADQLEWTLGRGRAELLRRIVQHPVSRDLEATVDRAWSALYAFILVAPAGLIEDIQPHVEAFEAWLNAPADAASKRRWEEETRPALVVAIRAHTGPAWRRPEVLGSPRK